MLYHERKREEELLGAEAAGESVWTGTFSDEMRQRIIHLMEMSAEDISVGRYDEHPLEAVVKRLRMSVGKPYLSGAGQYGARYELSGWLRKCNDGQVAGTVEAIYEGIKGWAVADTFAEGVREWMRRERISFDLIEGRMVPKESQELHAEVVAPALRLLSGRSGWEDVEARYQDALKEHDPGDAITDAGAALEAALKAVGCEGKALGDLLKDARAIDLFAGHDSKLNDAIAKVVDWASADRSKMGDAHIGGSPTREDAWLAIHIVGALILRLTTGAPRGRTSRI